MTFILTWLASKFGLTLGKWAILPIEFGVAVAAFLAAWALFAHHYQAKGVAQEHAKTVAVQAALDTCHQSNAALEAQGKDQTAKVNANSAADAKSLATATQKLKDAQGQVTSITVARQRLAAPVAISAIQPVACLIPNPEAQRLLEGQRRLMQ